VDIDGARFAFFDVDHTITRHSTGRRFVEYGYSHGLFRFKELLGVPMFYLRYRFGEVDLEDLSRDMAPMGGKSRAEVERIARSCYTEAIVPDIYDEAETLIGELKAAGIPVGLATSSIEVLVSELNGRLDSTVLLATRLEYQDDITTGRTYGYPCFGIEKRRRALAHLASIGVAPEECAFFSDSRYDLPLLQAIGFPVAVNPDRSLFRVARSRGWPVQRFRR
jgi:HAD superfamily hydrolase (TIGR01490 family)